ncbi:hypothetical protein AO826_20320 [Xanthomonas phaseoli pv. manihotis]|nr:hypothetical protein AO826_20320 [Xanthomonas phaseoli pv. manihotis]
MRGDGIGLCVFDIEHHRRGAICNHVVFVCGVAEQRGDLMPALHQQRREQARHLAVAADDEKSGHAPLQQLRAGMAPKAGILANAVLRRCHRVSVLP